MGTEPQRAKRPVERGSARRLGALLAAACALYFLHLGGLHNVKIGDETNYLQLARVTATLPGWLPLSTDDGPWSTKPPLLFWQGIASAKLLGETLFGYRLVSVLYTLATAALVARFARRETGDARAALLAALVFLACFSSFRYGRAYLTNPPEVFWSFCAFSLVVHHRPRSAGASWLHWTALGLILGVVTLYRSFALVAPYCLFLLLACRRDRVRAGGAWARDWLVRDVPRVAYVGALGLACFGLWFALDPDPSEVWDTFVRGENAGKVDERGYFAGLFSGSHTIVSLWAGHLVNAVLLALPLLGLVVVAWRRRRSLSRAEALGWTFVLAYLVAFSLPSQRSASYVMSGVPVLAVLLALRWTEVPAGWMRGAIVPFAIAFPLFLVLGARVQLSGVLDPGIPWWYWPATALGAAVAWRAIRDGERARGAVLPLTFLLYLALTGALWPLEGPAGRYDDDAIARARGADLLMPTNHLRKHERYHFLLEPASVTGYEIHGLDLPEPSRIAIEDALARGGVVGVVLPEGEDPLARYPGAEVLGSRVDVRTRHNGEQIRAMLLRGEMDLLLVREWLLRGRP